MIPERLVLDTNIVIGLLKKNTARGGAILVPAGGANHFFDQPHRRGRGLCRRFQAGAQRH